MAFGLPAGSGMVTRPGRGLETLITPGSHRDTYKVHSPLPLPPPVHGAAAPGAAAPGRPWAPFRILVWFTSRVWTGK
jgi:hypothetical protein